MESAREVGHERDPLWPARWRSGVEAGLHLTHRLLLELREWETVRSLFRVRTDKERKGEPDPRLQIPRDRLAGWYVEELRLIRAMVSVSRRKLPQN
jgi:hypothetical protein